MTKQIKRGFTLIELLVVVLIIGILAAVAVPQYKVAVEKSRLTEAIVAAKNIKDAQERYYLTYGDYTTKVKDLDIGFPSYGTSSISVSNTITLYTNAKTYVYGINTAKTITIKFNYAHHPKQPNLQFCFAKSDDHTANQVCKSIGGILDKEDVTCTVIGQCNTYMLE